jgi:hypothetical protein
MEIKLPFYRISQKYYTKNIEMFPIKKKKINTTTLK